MKNAVKRGARTFLQAFIGVAIAQGGFTLTQTDLALLRSCAAAGIAAVLAFAWNLLDDKGE